ncbi:tetratricopeptide repeat protein [Bacillus halotolerans]|uniref:response regulator aspartate phosphatase n=1 Tax=Bacillus halotolerans TaxID=260554 RepID=UPI001C3CCF91|nr:tetratricopeptide repeat protein [Bacillus halotolerans]MBV5121914.1 tetratricopeptide repeat protein [Bacillus halotolerans]MDG0764657.1 tetratricopeptide repeat protein [Bacillus halotolerans]UUI83970.1 tetratricopeptide repeat protein [Bacillus halotolerans]UYO31659.1 tetratricopeptide repeat protein [Bacillus halotolerans]
MISKFIEKRIQKMLNEWYTAIGKRKMDDAAALKEKIDQHLPKLKKNTKLWMRYQLFLARHQLLFENQDGLDPLFHELYEQEDKMDDELKYYLHFFSGLYEMVKTAPKHAVNGFKKAEQHLHAIQNAFEAADFYYQTAGAYYLMKSPPLSIQYVEKALNIYLHQFGYVKKVISCKLLLAVNYIDQERYDEAEQLFKEIIRKTQQVNDDNLLCHAYYNLGFLKATEKKDHEALLYFKKVLKNHEFETNSPVSYLHCVYESVRALFKTEKTSEGKAVLQKGKELSEKVNIQTIQLKLKTLEALYTSAEDPYDTLLEYVLELEKIEAWVDLEVLLEDITEYYKKKDDFEKAAFFIMRG